MGATGEQVRRERRDVQRNLERVLRAAQELFAERGADVRMEEVAHRAGVGVGTIYRRFPSKEQLFAAVSLAACEDTRHCLAQAAEDADDSAAKLRAIIVAHYRRCLLQAPLLDGPPPHGEPTPDAVSEADTQRLHPGLYPALHALVAEVIAAGQAQGRLRAGDPATLAALALELLSPRAVQRISHAVGACDAAAEQVADFILAGLRP
ncbi:MAG TPA: helix-turn-helix domain-containing protein [Chloroflexaceae bacterium]|nr:helix-turn-helix domain-containing protein [Chloroflexaceae bacterium]